VDAIKRYIEEAEVWEGEKTLAAIAKLRERFGGAASQRELLTKNNKEQDDKRTRKDVKMSSRDWDLLSPGSETRRYSVGEIVLAYGVVNRHLFRVKRGTVRVEKVINGQVIVIDKMEEKSTFGEISMLLRAEQGTTTASIIADSNGTEIIKYKIDFVLEMCRHESSLSEKLHKIIALKLSERLRNFGKKKYITEEIEKESEEGDKSAGENFVRKSSRPVIESGPPPPTHVVSPPPEQLESRFSS